MRILCFLTAILAVITLSTSNADEIVYVNTHMTQKECLAEMKITLIDLARDSKVTPVVNRANYASALIVMNGIPATVVCDNGKLIVKHYATKK